MEFDNTRPIWLQIVEEYSRRIAVGLWEPGLRLGGVRDLALELGVNPNTLQRAFGDLERDGLVRVERASGRYVTDDPLLIARLRHRLATEAADDFIGRLRGFGISKAGAEELLEGRWGDDHDDENHRGKG